MKIFDFDESALLGQVRAVDTRSLNIHVNSNENLRKARVGQLVAVALPGPLDEWLVGVIVRVLKSVTTQTHEGPAGHGLNRSLTVHCGGCHSSKQRAGYVDRHYQ